jgi:hypothetical protein
VPTFFLCLKSISQAIVSIFDVGKPRSQTVLSNKPEGFKEEFLERREDAPRSIQGCDDF